MYNEDPRSAELYKGTYVAEVTMAYKDGSTLRRYVAKQHLVRLERRYKALIQMYSHGSEYHDLDETGALRSDAEKKLARVQKRLSKISSNKGEAFIGSGTRIRRSTIPKVKALKGLQCARLLYLSTKQATSGARSHRRVEMYFFAAVSTKTHVSVPSENARTTG